MYSISSSGIDSDEDDESLESVEEEIDCSSLLMVVSELWLSLLELLFLCIGKKTQLPKINDDNDRMTRNLLFIE